MTNPYAFVVRLEANQSEPAPWPSCCATRCRSPKRRRAVTWYAARPRAISTVDRFA